MKTQTSTQHINTFAVQRPTLLNITFKPGLFLQAFFMLLLIAAIVVPGAAQGIYVADLNSYGASRIGEYNLDGTPKNPSLFSPGGYSWSLAMFESRLVVPGDDQGGCPGWWTAWREGCNKWNALSHPLCR